jgi:hypothetical protein
MANFKDSPHFEKHDHYYTAKESWEQLSSIKEEVKINCSKILEACCMNAPLSKSDKYLNEIFGLPVKRNEEDFLSLDTDETRRLYDIIITNPPFTNPIKKNIIKKLLDIDRPFIIILNSTNIYSKWFRETMGDKIKDIQILTPKQKLKYNKAIKNEEGEWELEKKTKDPSFYSCFVSYKLNLPNEKLFL